MPSIRWSEFVQSLPVLEDIDDVNDYALGEVNSVAGRIPRDLFQGSTGAVGPPGPPVGGYATLFDAYATKADGPPVTSDSGHTWFGWELNAASEMEVISGVLTNAATSGTAAGYLQHDFGEPVTRLGADLVFGAYTAATGSFALAAWATEYSGGAVPDCNCHFTIKPTGWTYGRFVSGVFTELAAGTFDTPLTADFATVYRVEIVLDLDNSIAYIDLPATHTGTGYSTVGTTTARIKHSSIGTNPGDVCVFETFASDAATGSKTGAVNVWADTAGVNSSARLGRLDPVGVISRLTELERTRIWAVEVSPSPAADSLATTTMAQVHADLNVTLNAPASGRVFVEVCAWLDMTADAQVFWQIASGATPFQFWKITNIRTRGLVTAHGIITSMTPNTTYTVELQHRCLTASTATIKLDSANAYLATMKLTELP